jgi:FtsH-binding integral membrane protein
MFYEGSILYNAPTFVIAVALLIGIFIFYLAGVSLGNYQKKNNPDAKAEGVGPLEGALLGLLALLLSFTFSMSASRYDTRRSLLIKEANDIGTVVLRADMYPDSIRREFRKDLKQYLEARIEYYDAGNDEEKINKSLGDAAKISDHIWQMVTRLSRESSATIPQNLMIPALGDMIDVVTSRDAARLARVPDPIFWLLIILTLLGSLIIGYSKKEKKNDWIVLSIYSLMTVITIYTIIDLDRPRHGIIRTDDAHQKIIELRKLFTE